MSNIIRKVSIGTDLEKSMNYVVGARHKIYVGDTPSFKNISAIEETESHYEIYLDSEDESSLWKKIPKNDQTAVEYVIE